jgi:hypothetical protein
MSIYDEILEAFWAGVSEEDMMRIFDLSYPELFEIIMHN